MLHREYKGKGKTQGEIADEWDCSRTTIRKWLEEHDIDKHDHDQLVSDALSEHYENKFDWHDEDTLYDLYIEKELSTIQISEKLGCSPRTVCRWLKRHGIEIRDRSEAVHLGRSPDSINGINYYIDEQGYPRIDIDGYSVRVHRYVAYAHSDIEFDEFDKMVTHHKNGVRFDNRPENLELMTNSEHAKCHWSV